MFRGTVTGDRTDDTVRNMSLETLFGFDLLLFLAIGLLGGAHCIGMCGPLVTIYSKQMDTPRSDGGTPTSSQTKRGTHLTLHEVRQHALFNLGRALSYALIGTAMGALGGVLFVSVHRVTGIVAIVRGVVGIGTGAFVVVVGVHYVRGRLGTGVRFPGLNRIVERVTRRVERWVNSPGIVGLGALHGFFPCPILYPAYLYAFASGSPFAGGTALLALGLGTVPALFVYGTLLGGVSPDLRQRLHRLLGLLFIALGYVLLAHGLMSFGVHLPHPELPFWGPLETGHSHG
jgi:sulfite exporter TauE/SafE